MSTSSFPPVGLLRRLMAVVYDTLLLFGLLFLATAVALAATGRESFTPADWGYHLYLLACAFGYFGWFWTRGGQTLGMRAWRLRVEDSNGAALDWREVAIRFFIAIVSWGVVGFGFLWQLIDPEKRTWHDRWSNSRTVVLPKKTRNRPSTKTEPSESAESKR